MSSRHTLYHAYCLASSAGEVLKGSASIAKESLTQWVNTSRITRPVLMQYQCYYDPQWEDAKKLSQEVKAKTHSPPKKSKRKTGVRHFSSSSRNKNDEVCK